ncbi:MAG: hypothetical protein A2Y54_09355 [Chloroflexi bacterium RBG_16_51_16]|nr:MAG: hypothetical protein A2Y54_09355 [Chloroflexi bacterium RBG_16_51_16]
MQSSWISLSVWLHAIATAVFIGHFVLLAVVYIPAFQGLKDNASFEILSRISKLSRTWLYAALAVFIITGTHLMLIDQNYLGLMNFGNLWGVVMLLKHGVILAMLAIGFWYNAIQRVGPTLVSSNRAGQAFDQFRRYTNWMAVLGILGLLLTAISQGQ